MTSFISKFLSWGFFLISLLMAFMALYFDSYKMTQARTVSLVILLAVTIPVCLISLIVYIYDRLDEEPQKHIPYITNSSTCRDYNTISIYYLSSFFTRLLLPIIFISFFTLPVRNIPGIAGYKMPFLLACYIIIILFHTAFMIYEGEETIRVTPNGISFYRYGDMHKFFPYRDFIQGDYTPAFLPFVDTDHIPTLVFKKKQNRQHKEGCFVANASFTMMLNDIRSLRERGVLSDFSAPSNAVPNFQLDPTLPAGQQAGSEPASMGTGIAPDSGIECSLPEQHMQQTSIQQQAMQSDFPAMHFTFSTSWYPSSVIGNIFLIILTCFLLYGVCHFGFRLGYYLLALTTLTPFLCIYSIVKMSKRRLQTLHLEQDGIKADERYISADVITEIRLTIPNSTSLQSDGNLNYRLLFIICGLKSAAYVVGDKTHQPQNNPMEYQNYTDFYMYMKNWCQQHNIKFTDFP